MPLCTTHLNGTCGHETSDSPISPGHIDGNNASLNRDNRIYYDSFTESDRAHYRFPAWSVQKSSCPQYRFSRTVARTKRRPIDPIDTKRRRGSIASSSVRGTFKPAQYTTSIAVLDRRRNLRNRENWIRCVGPPRAQGCLVQTDHKDTDKLDVAGARDVQVNSK